MAYFECVRCKSTDLTDPSIKTMVNECGHSICERCIEIAFTRGVGVCPACSRSLKRSNFTPQEFKSAEVERYRYVRRKYMKDFILFETDFATPKEYDDYLEELETIAFNLTHYRHEEAMMMRIEKFKQENQEAIKRNRNKKDPRLLELENEIEEEKQRKKESDDWWKAEDDRMKMEKEKARISFFKDLESSDRTAKEIVEDYNTKRETMKFSTGIPMGKQDAPKMPPPIVMGDAFIKDTEYKPLQLNSEGPEVPEEEDLRRLGYLNNVRGVDLKETGCGFRPEIFCTRALRDAYNGLFIFVEGRN